jgi:uncharacterized protein YjbI with pentapeptide repeats
MNTPLISESLTSADSFICACEEWERPVCIEEGFYREHEGRRYCVLHYPSAQKIEDFRKAFEKKLKRKDFDFRSVWFPASVYWINAEFNSAFDMSGARFLGEANFTGTLFKGNVFFRGATFVGRAIFGGATFSRLAEFSGTTFTKTADFSLASFLDTVNFNEATFKEAADFLGATFQQEANFRTATLNERANFMTATFSNTADFTGAKLSGMAEFVRTKFGGLAKFTMATFSGDADFEGAIFSGATNFCLAIVHGYVRLAGQKSVPMFKHLDLQGARIEIPDHLSFHSLTMRPIWFINVDARRIDFVNVQWEWDSIKDAIHGRFSRHRRLLAIACRHLAVNAEDNHRYEEASKFRYLSMDARRLETWHGFGFWRLDWWYWVASGYGERASQALVALLVLWVSFSCIFFVGQARGHWWRPEQSQVQKPLQTNQTINELSRTLTFGESLTYSGGVIMLQRPEPVPDSKLAKMFVLLETILGPVQAALLALAIRRKFMR